MILTPVDGGHGGKGGGGGMTPTGGCDEPNNPPAYEPIIQFHSIVKNNRKR